MKAKRCRQFTQVWVPCRNASLNLLGLLLGVGVLGCDGSIGDPLGGPAGGGLGNPPPQPVFSTDVDPLLRCLTDLEWGHSEMVRRGADSPLPLFATF